jgi:hypothetical protein
MLPFVVALLLVLIGAAMLVFRRRTQRPQGDALDRALDIEGKWGGVAFVIVGVVMLVVLVNRAI